MYPVKPLKLPNKIQSFIFGKIVLNAVSRRSECKDAVGGGRRDF